MSVTGATVEDWPAHLAFPPLRSMASCGITHDKRGPPQAKLTAVPQPVCPESSPPAGYRRLQQQPQLRKRHGRAVPDQDAVRVKDLKLKAGPRPVPALRPGLQQIPRHRLGGENRVLDAVPVRLGDAFAPGDGLQQLIIGRRVGLVGP